MGTDLDAEVAAHALGMPDLHGLRVAPGDGARGERLDALRGAVVHAEPARHAGVDVDERDDVGLSLLGHDGWRDPSLAESCSDDVDGGHGRNFFHSDHAHARTPRRTYLRRTFLNRSSTASSPPGRSVLTTPLPRTDTSSRNRSQE